ncbi:MAG: hypothetical protein IPF98_08555 [Gemmatimonadetes bacterium]|nr:hypothetical protein [Gemmatimonadota bacterium]
MAGDTLVAEGVASASWRGEAQRLALAVAGVTALQLTGLADSATVALRAAADSLEVVSFDFPTGSTEPVAGQQPRVAALAGRLRTLLTDAASANLAVRIDLIGSADSVGSEATNAVLRRGRASRIRAALVASGVRPDLVVATSDTSTSSRVLRQVRLRIAIDER